MKKYSKLLLIAVFVTLIAGSVQSVTANHSEPGAGYFLNPKPDHYDNLIVLLLLDNIYLIISLTICSTH